MSASVSACPSFTQATAETAAPEYNSRTGTHRDPIKACCKSGAACRRLRQPSMVVTFRPSKRGQPTSARQHANALTHSRYKRPHWPWVAVPFLLPVRPIWSRRARGLGSSSTSIAKMITVVHLHRLLSRGEREVRRCRGRPHLREIDQKCDDMWYTTESLESFVCRFHRRYAGVLVG